MHREHDPYSDDHSEIINPLQATQELVRVARVLSRRVKNRPDRVLPPDARDILQMSQKQPRQLLRSIAHGMLTRNELDAHKRALVRASFTEKSL